MKALLLSGGEGTRLRPFTLTIPKPLLPVANIPLISYQFELLKRYGITEVIVGVGYKADCFRKVVGKIAKDMGIKASFSVENTPLGTGGGLRNAYPFFRKDKEPFVVFNGDVIADFNLDKIIAFHKEKNAYLTIGLVRISNPSSYGLVITDSDMSIKKFIEKPSPEEIICDTINSGVYIFSPEIFSEIPSGRPVSLEKEIFPSLLEKGKKIYAYIHYGYWIDVGTVEKYRKVNFDALEGKTGIFAGKGQRSNLITGTASVLKEGVEIKGRAVIGNKCFIGKNCIIEESIIMDGAVIKDNCVISNSVIGTDVLIENDCCINNMALSDRSFIGAFTR
ncbi:MAG TPA: NDP-sugar synthase [bacterium]|nr:NDP-sugar synthase [bacterium]HPP30451.1 NDP-sugar synthase [bacterium]